MLSRITFCLTVVLLTTSQLAIAVGCPNGGAALGYYKSCWGSGSPICQYYTFIATHGTCNRDATRSGSNGCGGGYTNGASVQCDDAGNTLTIRPPGMGVHKCSKKPIVCDDDSWNYQKIEFCCYPV